VNYGFRRLHGPWGPSAVQDRCNEDGQVRTNDGGYATNTGGILATASEITIHTVCTSVYKTYEASAMTVHILVHDIVNSDKDL
jgi:hypothetical protein